MISVPAYAKVNLTLEVIARRDDGYHEIRSVLQTICLADELSFEPAAELAFEYRDDRETARVDLLRESVLKAAQIFREQSGYHRGAIITLRKLRIPRAAGLGSSATVPAAVLKGLNQLWALGLPVEKLREMAAALGSDTPFFISGGTALAEGRGEKITSLPTAPPVWLVLLAPPIDPVPGKTAAMYSSLNRSHFSSGAATERLIEILHRGTALQADMLYNSFERVAFAFFPRLGEYRQKLLDAGAVRVHLAGAGPALFALVANKASGESIAGELRTKGLEACVVQTV